MALEGMVIRICEYKKKFRIFNAFLGMAFLFSSEKLISGEMPTGAKVQSGNISITNKSSDHMVIDQSTNKSIINWNSFSIHKKGQVDFNMPSSSSSSLNRVTGSVPSTIAGKLNSNGKVMIINPNGVMITKEGLVKTGSFTASTLDINNKDFLKDRFKFKGDGNSKSVSNKGKIINITKPGGPYWQTIFKN